MKLSLTVLEGVTITELARQGLVLVYLNDNCLDVVSLGNNDHLLGIGGCWCDFRIDIGKYQMIVIHNSPVDMPALQA